MVPVGLKPPANTAASLSVTGVVPSVTVTGLGVVVIVGLAALMVTRSFAALLSLAALLLVSPL